MNYIIHGVYQSTGCTCKLYHYALSVEHVLRLAPALYPGITITSVEEL
jgi:hypothetical protein